MTNPDDNSWIILVRNPDEIPKHLYRHGQWNINWYIMHNEAFNSGEMKSLMALDFNSWVAMFPTTLDNCVEVLNRLMRDLKSRDLTVDWKCRNILTGEEVPGVIFND